MEQSINNYLKLRVGVSSDEEFSDDSKKYAYGLALSLQRYELSFASEQYVADGEDITKYMISFNASVF